MCKAVDKVKSVLSNLREYSREIVTFGGFAIAVFVYTDFRTVVEETTKSQAQTAEILRTLDTRLNNIEQRIK